MKYPQYLRKSVLGGFMAHNKKDDELRITFFKKRSLSTTYTVGANLRQYTVATTILFRVKVYIHPWLFAGSYFAVWQIRRGGQLFAGGRVVVLEP
jgi:hypothetical protein